MDDSERIARAMHAIMAQTTLPRPKEGEDYDALTDEQRGQLYEFARRLDTMLHHRWAKPKNEAPQGEPAPHVTSPGTVPVHGGQENEQEESENPEPKGHA